MRRGVRQGVRGSLHARGDDSHSPGARNRALDDVALAGTLALGDIGDPAIISPGLPGRDRVTLSAAAPSSPAPLRSARTNWSEKAVDPRPVFRIVGRLVGQMLIPEFSGRRLQFADHRSEVARVA